MKLNPDKNFVLQIRKEIADNGGYCPCQVAKTKDTKCPCTLLRNKKECVCGLYVK